MFLGILADNGQADPVECQCGAPPVTRVVAGEQQAAVFQFGQVGSLFGGGSVAEFGLDLFFVRAQVLHEACQKGGFQVRIVRARLPHGAFFAAVSIGFAHAFVGEEDVCAAVFGLFDADDEFVALAGGVNAAQADFFEQAAEAAAGEFGTVFRPVGFHLADGGFFACNGKAAFLPEGFQQRPQFGGFFAGYGQPALAAVPFHFDTAHACEDGLAACMLVDCAVAVDVAGADGTAAGRQLVKAVLPGVGQVGRNFEVHDFAVLRLIVEFGLFFFAARTCGQAEEGKGQNGGFDWIHTDSVWD